MTKDEALKMAIEAFFRFDDKSMSDKDYFQLCKDASFACEEALETPECNPHPKAPHGFNRNASHSAGRYVCECEGWELEFVGLSDDEITILIPDTTAFKCEVSIEECIEFARAVEQALKEKNT